MHYKLYLSAPLAQQSFTIRATLFNKKGEIAHEFFYKSQGNSFIEGYYKVPFEQPSGVYKLIFSATTENGIQPHELAHIFVPIYNDLTPLESTASMNLSKELPDLVDNLNVEIKLNKNQFSNREEIYAEINVTDKNGAPVNGNLSVTVLQKDAADIFADKNIAINPAEVYLQQPDDNIFYQGRIFDTLDQPIPSRIIGVYSPDNQDMLYTKVAKENLFALKVEDFTGVKPIQFIGSQREVMAIKVELEKFMGKDLNFPELFVDDAIISYLEESRQRKKMAQHFESMQNNLDLQEFKVKKETLKSDFSYNIKEYVQFETMGDFFSELLTPLRFKIEDKTYSAKMYNPTSRKALNNELSGIPLFILDGKLTRDADFIGKQKLDKIEKVELFFKPETIRPQFNVIGLSGIAMIQTEEMEFDLPEQDAADIFTITGLQPEIQPAEASPTALERNLPSFSPQIHWSSEVNMDKSGRAQVTFLHNDDHDNFLIQVVAYSSDGQYGMAKMSYNVVSN